MYNMYTKFHISKYNRCKENKQKVQIFLSPRGITLSKITPSYPTQKRDLDSIMINLYSKFYCNICILFEENEQRLQIILVFFSTSNIGMLYEEKKTETAND